MSDTELIAVEVPTFDPDAIRDQAAARVAQIQGEITLLTEQRKSISARIRDLHVEAAKSQKLVNALTPRTRARKPKVEAKAPTAKAAGASKKAQ